MFVRLSAFVATYGTLAVLSRWLLVVPGNPAALWPPGGLLLGVLLLTDRRHWVWWLVATLPIEVAATVWLFDGTPAMGLVAFAANAVEAVVGALILREVGGRRFRLDGVREVLALVAVGAGLAPAIGATIGAAGLAATGGGSFLAAWPLWWIGDAAGVLIFAPLVLAAFGNAEPAYQRRRTGGRAELFVLFAALLVVSQAVFTYRIGVSFVLIPLLLWAALRFGIAAVATCCVAMAIVATHHTAAGHGPFAFAGVRAAQSQWLLQSYLLILAVSAFVVAALDQQRRAGLLALQRANEELEWRVRERTAQLQTSDAQLREHAEVFRAMFALSTVPKVETDPQSGRLLRVNTAFCRLTGFDPPELLAGTLSQITHPDDRQPFGWYVDAAQPTLERETRLVRRDGVVLHVQATLNHVRDEGGRSRGIGVIQDVTQRRQADALLRASHETFRHLVENSPFGIYVVDADFRLVQASLGAQKIFENAKPWLGRDFAEVLRIVWPDPFAEETIARFRRTLADGEPFRAGASVERRRDTEHLESYDWQIERLVLPDGRHGVVCHFYDLSERQRYEAALRDSEARFRQLFEHAATGIAIGDWTGAHLVCNPALCALLGHDAPTLGTLDLATLLHPDDRAEADAELGGLRRGERPCVDIETRCVRRDGAVVWVRLFVSVLPLPGDRRLMMLVTDMTARRQMETALREADRRKDEFLATLAHELRNPLAPIGSAVAILRARGERDDPASSQALAVIERQHRQLVRLVDDLLEVSRITRGTLELRRERVALRAIVQSAVETARPLIDASHHRLALALPETPIWLDADLVRIAQVVANLLNNAARYTPAGGHITLSAQVEGGMAIVRVGDDGIGIAPAMLPKVFEMFTRAEGVAVGLDGGLGIGLALVKQLVEAHGGQVAARSDGLGRGSEFSIRLPLAAEPVPCPEAAPAAPAATPSRARRTLVVDDNRDAADSLGTLLQLMGNDVRIAHDGASALAIAREFRPELALLDIGMPGMDGHELARRLRGEHARLELVALTGWGQAHDRFRSREAGFDHHFVKPIALHDLEWLFERPAALGPVPGGDATAIV